MFYCRSTFVMTWAALVVFHAAVAMSDERKAGDGLVEFKSEEGKFSIQLPGKPEYETVEVGTAKEKQHQFKVGTDRGAYIVSYQENPNLKGSSPKKLAAALEAGRDRLKEVFRGKQLESKSVTFDKTYPGLSFRLTIPDASGEARCRFYMVGTRLYQIMAIGMPEFANSDEASQVIESFKLLK